MNEADELADTANAVIEMANLVGPGGGMTADRLKDLAAAANAYWRARGIDTELETSW